MILRFIGRTFIVTGLLILLFLGYQLFGTSFITERNQSALAADFSQIAAAPAPVATPKPELGEGIALIEIPKVGLKQIVVEGVGVDALKKGPGHYPGTSLPGEVGNVVISGHRTTYGAPFYRIDELAPGDLIKLTDRTGEEFFYKVSEKKIVLPTDRSVVVKLPEAKLTLTTCHPRFSARQRLIIVADLMPKGTTR